MLKMILSRFGLLAVLVTLQCGSARGQCPEVVGPGVVGPPAGVAGPPGLGRLCIYSVKFVCGLQQPNFLLPPLEPPVKAGNYATAVNIQNFHNTPVTISKKAVIANPEEQPLGQISNFQKFSLPPDGAFEIDCCDIVHLLLNVPSQVRCQELNGRLPSSFIKGFVEVTSPLPLSVTGVYTAEFCEPHSDRPVWDRSASRLFHSNRLPVRDARSLRIEATKHGEAPRLGRYITTVTAFAPTRCGCG